MRVGVAIPDQHWELIDQKAVSCVIQAINLIQPDIFINLGDVGEWESVSAWKYKRRKRPPTNFVLDDLKKDAELVNAGLDRFDKALPKKCNKYLTTGNHDSWCDLFVDEVEQDHGELDHYRFNNICHLEERGYEVFPEGKIFKLGKLNFVHGMYASQAHAKRHLDTLGQNIMYGHNHDIQWHTQTKLDGTIGAWSIGCLKDMSREKNKWLRGRLHNWAHAFAIIHFWDNGTFRVDVVPIINGKTTVWGKEIIG